MACFLPSWYKFYWVQARSRYKFDKRPGNSPGRLNPEEALAQCRGVICPGARKLSWCRMFIGSS
jgi:hypothetical protein